MNDKEKILQTSKKRLSNGKWSYRNYVLIKEESKWKVLDKEYFKDDQSEKVKKIEPQKTIKDICFKIDEILGDLPESSRKKVKKQKSIKKLEEDKNENIRKAKKIAYDIRWDIEKILEEENEDDSLINRLAIPVGQGKVSGDTTFILKWNRNFDFISNVLDKYNEEGVEINEEQKDGITELKVKVKKIN